MNQAKGERALHSPNVEVQQHSSRSMLLEPPKIKTRCYIKFSMGMEGYNRIKIAEETYPDNDYKMGSNNMSVHTLDLVLE